MISQLTGKIININDKSLFIDVNGIGYQVFCSSQTIFQFKNILRLCVDYCTVFSG